MMETSTNPSWEGKGIADETAHQAVSSLCAHINDVCIHREWIRNHRIPNRGVSYQRIADEDPVF